MRSFADSADFFVGSLSFLKGFKLNFVNFYETLFRGYNIIQGFLKKIKVKFFRTEII